VFAVTILAVVFISILLFSAVGGLQLVNLANCELTVSVDSPQNITYTTHNIMVSISAVDPELHTGPDSVGYILDGKAPVTLARVHVGMHGLSGNATLSLPNGTHSIVGFANTWFGQETINSSVVYFTIDAPGYFDSDITEPNINILSPTGTIYDGTGIQLNFTTNEPVTSMSYSIDGKNNVTITGNITLPELSHYAHRITVYATDTAGNTGTSTCYFSVAQETKPPQQPEPEPFPTVLVAAVVVSLAVVVAGLLVYFRKRSH
jgi:hypothetical protein